MNAETIAKLIVMVCEVIKQRSGGTGLEAQIADRVMAEVTPMLPRASRRRLPRGKKSLSAGGGGSAPVADDGHPWLQVFLAHAERKRWCVKIYCTTCGASMFRNELVKRAATQAGVNVPPEALRRGEFVSKHLNDDDLMLCGKTIAEGLAEIQEPKNGDFNMPATYLILNDLRRMVWPFLGILENAIEGSWAADANREIEEDLVAQREWEAERPARQKEERRLAAERKAKAVAERKRNKVERDRRRRRFLDELATLPPKPRIERLLDDDTEFPIAAVPAELIPDSAELVAILEPDNRARLIETIGHRRGSWAPLKKALAAIDSSPEGDRS